MKNYCVPTYLGTSIDCELLKPLLAAEGSQYCIKSVAQRLLSLILSWSAFLLGTATNTVCELIFKKSYVNSEGKILTNQQILYTAVCNIEKKLDKSRNRTITHN